MRGTLYDTIEEAAVAGRDWAERFGSTNIFQDPETDKYWTDSAASITTFFLRNGTSPTHEPMAKVLRDGTIVLTEKKLRPGDLEFIHGNVYEIYGVGDPKYGLYSSQCIKKGVRLPSFRKQCRENDYTIIRENTERRTAVARKEG